MINEPKYNWKAETGEATCILTYRGMEFEGKAFCHPDDMDMASKLTGWNIAEARAIIKHLKYVRDFELKAQLKVLHQFYNTINTSKRFNEQSYESYMLRKRIKNLQLDLDAVKEEIAITKKFLNEYIEMKLRDHKMIREYREKNKLVENNQK